MRIPLRLIAPLACERPEAVDRYVAMLQAGEMPPPVYLIKQRDARAHSNQRTPTGDELTSEARLRGAPTTRTYPRGLATCGCIAAPAREITS
jgi:hypothetical protein